MRILKVWMVSLLFAITHFSNLSLVAQNTNDCKECRCDKTHFTYSYEYYATDNPYNMSCTYVCVNKDITNHIVLLAAIDMLINNIDSTSIFLRVSFDAGQFQVNFISSDILRSTEQGIISTNELFEYIDVKDLDLLANFFSVMSCDRGVKGNEGSIWVAFKVKYIAKEEAFLLWPYQGIKHFDRHIPYKISQETIVNGF